MAVQGNLTKAAYYRLERHANARGDEVIRNQIMQPTSKFRSDAFEAIHSSASALLKVGAIGKATMRDFEVSCLSVPATAAVVGWVSGAPPTDAS